jgi:hypothetical protein
MRAARIVDNVVIEAADLPSGIAIDEAFPLTLGFVDVPADVEQGMVRDEDGGFAFPPAPQYEPPVPASISPLQARNALRAWGIGKAEIAAFFASIEDQLQREAAEDAWEYATSIERANPLIAACAAHLGKTAEEVDQFFRDAAAL